MASRFTETKKWGDLWFVDLTPIEKILFIYMVDNCDIAGFIEVNIRIWASMINCSPIEIKTALNGLQRGLIASKDGNVFYIRNFIKHQKNYPLNPKNNSTKGILACFENYSELFNIEDIDLFIQGASKGLNSPISKGNSNGNGNDDEFNEKRKLEIESEYSNNKKYYQNIIDLGEDAHKQLKSIAGFLIKNDMVDLISLKPLTAYQAEDIYKKMLLKFDKTADVEVFFIKMNGYINKKYSSLYAMAIAWLDNQKDLNKD